MRKIGFSLKVNSGKIIVDLEKAITTGFTHIELKWGKFTPQNEQKELITHLLDMDWHGISLSLHTPLQNVNISALSQVERKKSVARINEVISISKELNTKFVVLHGGKIPAGLPRDQKTREKAFVAQLESINEISLYCKEHGILIALENGYSLNDLGLLTSIDDMALIAEFVDGLSFLLDIGHFILNSPLQNIRKQLENYPHLQFSAIHLHDNKQIADDHLSLGEGILLRQEKELKAILESINTCPIIIECTSLTAALKTRSTLLKRHLLM
jgi:sugar phosphate isomerase/epimerase